MEILPRGRERFGIENDKMNAIKFREMGDGR